MIDEGAPLSEYRDNAVAGAKQIATGICLLIFSALYGYYIFRERGIEGWQTATAHVTSTSVFYVNGSRGSGHFSVHKTAK
jgi:hypothetical protein